jgi:hypothetical protein
MRKLMLGMGAALLVAVPGSVAGQTPVSVTLQVTSSATFGAATALDFGTLAPGAAAATVAVTHDNTGGTTVGSLAISHVGNFTVTGSTVPTELTGTGDPIAISFACQLAGSASGSTGMIGSSVAGCTSMPYTAGGTGTKYLRVGGTLAAIPETQAAGTYTANISFTVAAN